MKYELHAPESTPAISSPTSIPCSDGAPRTASTHHPNPAAFNFTPPAGIPPLLPDVLSDGLPLLWDENPDIWDHLVTSLGVSATADAAPVPRATTSPELDLVLSDSQEFPPHPPEFSPAFGGSRAVFAPPDAASLSERKDLNVLDPAGDGAARFDYVDDLIRAAGCVDADELYLVPGILDRLNRRLAFPAGKPLERAAFFFKEGLLSVLAGFHRPARCFSSSEIVQTIRAYSAFSRISPIPMFSHFTANQVLLEAVGGSPSFHVIDFDIGLGGKWASFMRDIADRSEICRVDPPVLRISAVVPGEFAAEARLIGDSLTQFAGDLGLEFQIEFVADHSFDALSFDAVKLMDRAKTAVYLSPANFARGGAPGFLVDLRRLSPCVAVLVDDGGWMEQGTASFRRNMVSGLEFYSVVLESLDANCGGGGGWDEWGERIEAHVVRPKIAAAVQAAMEAAAAGGGGRRVAPWKEALAGAGLRAAPLSPFAVFQAEVLVGKAQVEGFHVARRQGEMVLCWHKRPLVATSAWRC